MNKSVHIHGKTNIDKINHKLPQDRLITNKWVNKNLLSNKDKHIHYLYNIKHNIMFNGFNDIIYEIKNKRNSYANQDVKMARYDPNLLISNDQIVNMLYKNKLKCYYCKDKCLLMYTKVRDNKQWTLDRINNDIGHYNDNVVIACLSCNLKRRLLDDEKFKFTKQLSITKLNT